jgi:hypothetical protein
MLRGMPSTQAQTFSYTAAASDYEASPLDPFLIQRMVDSWAIWRDTRWWDRIEELWHPEGKMVTTWNGLAGSAQFAEAAQSGYEAGDRMLHSDGGCTVDIVGNRAVSQTKLRIMQRAEVDGVVCEVVCIGRDYDLLEYKNGKWGFLLRQPIYERDWISPVASTESVRIDPEELRRYPEGYAHLAVLQARLGYDINANLPTRDNARLDELYACGEQWLRRGVIDWSI